MQSNTGLVAPWRQSAERGGWCLMGLLVLVSLLLLTGCEAQEQHRAVTPEPAPMPSSTYTGPRYPLVLGQVENRSPYQNGLFSDGKDRLGNQAKQILKTHLAQTNRFRVLDRDNMGQLKDEANLAGTAQTLTGARVVVTGAVTEFGRKETGAEALGGILGGSRTQTAYAKVSLNVVDVTTSEVVYAVQGAGEFDLKNEHVLGFGSTAAYDATLVDKVINLAMAQAVARLVEGLQAGQWRLGE